ncbi:MAG TPA: cytochrome c oxidase assembly protein [Blastocatellia bacterium]|nr:cytochrome c oxidase assembly protein [Blastocatellia bacterium]
MSILITKIKLSRVRRLAFTALLAIVAARPVFAHEGKPHSPADLWKTWGWEPVVIACLALSAWLYLRGVLRLWRASAPGLGVRKWEAAAYAAGWMALFVGLVSPLHPMGRVLFSAHMTQHEVLMLVAAPLLVLGRPLIPFIWSLPSGLRPKVGALGKAKWFEKGWRMMTNPLFAWAIHAVALWVWHAPDLFQATIDDELIHTMQHVSFLGSALIFWWAIIHSNRGLMSYGAAVLYTFTTSIHSGLLGALITFSSSVWYPAYAETTSSWGLTPLEDQQLGGLIMWIPAGLVYIVAGLALFAGWMREAERRMQLKHAGGRGQGIR